MKIWLLNSLSALRAYSLLEKLILKHNDSEIAAAASWAIDNQHYALVARLLAYLANQPDPDGQVQSAVARLKNQAVDLIRLRKFRQAWQMLEPLLQYEPFSSDFAMRSLEVEALEGLGAAAECLKRLIHLCQAHPGRQETQPLIDRIVLQPLQEVSRLRASRNFKEALRLLNPFLQIDPYNKRSDLRLAQAECFFHLGKLGRAMRILKALRQEYPTDAAIEQWYQTALALLNRRNKQNLDIIVEETNGKRRIKNAGLSVAAELESQGKVFSVRLKRGIRSYVGLFVSMSIFICIGVLLWLADNSILWPGVLQTQYLHWLNPIVYGLVALSGMNWLWLKVVPGARPQYELHIDSRNYRKTVLYIKSGVFTSYKASVPLTEIRKVQFSRSFLDILTNNAQILIAMENGTIALISPLSPAECEELQEKLNAMVLLADVYRGSKYN